MMTPPPIPPWLKDLVKGRTPTGAFLCWHDRQLSICAECAPVADRAFRRHYQQPAPPALGDDLGNK